MSIKKYIFTVEVNTEELTKTYLEAIEETQPDSLESMLEHECHLIEGSGMYVKEIKEVTQKFQTLKDWFEENLGDRKEDISNYGADGGYPCITYTSDCCEIFDQFADEIWDMAVTDAEDIGYKNVAEMIATFGRSDML